ncbi:hypothetical protein ABT063_09915 [Streptomyces sp. NPDC002838]|uniref:hypothetical protein n=1 Tax=Streptomyces sp. NPDC002838 TaxID=3154436 RepID=UPI00331AE0E9
MGFGPRPSVYTQSTVTANQQRRKRRGTVLGALTAVLVVVSAGSTWLLWDPASTQSDKPSAAAAHSPLDVRETDASSPGAASVPTMTWGGGTDAYAMDGGERRRRIKATGNCEHMGAGGGDGLVVRLECWSDAAVPIGSYQSTTYRVPELDPKTGGTMWTYALAKGVRDIRLVSSDPAVLAVSADEIGVTGLITLDDHGRYRTTIGLEGGNQSPSAPANRRIPPPRTARRSWPVPGRSSSGARSGATSSTTPTGSSDSTS